MLGFKVLGFRVLGFRGLGLRISGLPVNQLFWFNGCSSGRAGGPGRTQCATESENIEWKAAEISGAREASCC